MGTQDQKLDEERIDCQLLHKQSEFLDEYILDQMTHR